MFRLCRVSNLQPLHHGANALPLSYEEQSNLCICYLSSFIPRQMVFLLNFTTAIEPRIIYTVKRRYKIWDCWNIKHRRLLAFCGAFTWSNIIFYVDLYICIICSVFLWKFSFYLTCVPSFKLQDRCRSGLSIKLEYEIIWK